MIEVLFSDSACGGLKMAQYYGEGEYRSGALSMFLSHPDGSQPTEEEIMDAKREFEERERLKWEKATAIGGNSSDIYGLIYSLSIGDISEAIPGEKRRQTLEWLYSIYPDIYEYPPFTDTLIKHGKAALEEALGRISSGEDVRIWYSNNPDELCGLYWFMAQISGLKLRDGQIILVSLPDWEMDENDNIVISSGWGSVSPGDWHKHLGGQVTAPPSFLNMCATQWERLRRENAPLRAVLNGRLVSVPETLYDEFISLEIEAEENEFHEAMVIGKVLGKYELGISDAWIAHRIERMISAGSLIPLTNAPPDSPIYHRSLKKLSQP